MTRFPKEILEKILMFIDYRDHRRVATEAVEDIIFAGVINAELISHNIQFNNRLLPYPFSSFRQLREAISCVKDFREGGITIDDLDKLADQFATISLNQEYEAELEEEYANYGYSNRISRTRATYHMRNRRN